jgi:hypothetical protein
MIARGFSLRITATAICISAAAAVAQTLPIPANLISLGGETGCQLLVHSRARQAY